MKKAKTSSLRSWEIPTPNKAKLVGSKGYTLETRPLFQRCLKKVASLNLILILSLENQ